MSWVSLEFDLYIYGYIEILWNKCHDKSKSNIKGKLRKTFIEQLEDS